LFQKIFAKTIQLLSLYAAEPNDSDEWRLKKTIGVVMVVIGSLSWLAYGLMYLPFHEPFAVIVCMSASILFALGLVSYVFFRHYAFHWYYWFVIMTLGVLLVHYIFGGFAQSGMVLLWLFLIPINTLVAYKPRHGLVMFLAIIALFVIAAMLQPYNPRLTNNLPPTLITWLFVMNTVGDATYMIVAVYYFIWRNEILSHLVLVEQEKAEALLLNILPREIVAILKDEKRVIADQFDSASILFADVVNFTPMSATMSPTELVELLNEVYSHFDTLVEKYDLEKIKTIGDCYMVAAGVPRRRPDHALVLTRLALDICDYVSQHEFCGHKLTFRIGINSGSVVAGVIGRKKFIYDLWGDTVNTASRMESHSAGGFIQVTEATYNLIKNDFVCEPRGTIQLKGKGEMPVWFVTEKKISVQHSK
jgi:guanylate cyclase